MCSRTSNTNSSRDFVHTSIFRSCYLEIVRTRNTGSDTQLFAPIGQLSATQNIAGVSKHVQRSNGSDRQLAFSWYGDQSQSERDVLLTSGHKSKEARRNTNEVETVIYHHTVATKVLTRSITAGARAGGLDDEAPNSACSIPVYSAAAHITSQCHEMNLLS